MKIIEIILGLILYLLILILFSTFILSITGWDTRIVRFYPLLSLILFFIAYLTILTFSTISLFEIYRTIRNRWRHPHEDSCGSGGAFIACIFCFGLLYTWWLGKTLGQSALLQMTSLTIILYFLILNVLYCVHLRKREKRYACILQKKGKRNPWDKKSLFHKLNDKLEFDKIVNWICGDEKMNQRIDICFKKQDSKGVFWSFIVPSIIIPTIAAVIFLMILHGKEGVLFFVFLLYICLFITGSKTISVLLSIFCVFIKNRSYYKLNNGVSVDTDERAWFQKMRRLQLSYKPFFLIPWEILPWLMGVIIVFVLSNDTTESISSWKDILFWQGFIIGVPYMLSGFSGGGWYIHFDEELEKDIKERIKAVKKLAKQEEERQKALKKK